MDLLDEARLAVLSQRARLGRPDAIPAARALELATLGGARALGFDSDIGSLEVGRSADFVAFPLDAAHVTPTVDPVTASVFSLAGRDAALVVLGGEPRVRDGRVIGEPAGLRARVQASAERLAEWRRSETGNGA